MIRHALELKKTLDIYALKLRVLIDAYNIKIFINDYITENE